MVNRQPLDIDTVLGDEYRIRGVLGHGGFGITYDAIDIKLETRRAIKEYFPNEMSHREGATHIQAYSGIHEEQFVWGRSRFLDEARLIAKFNHPNIVKVIRMFEQNNTAYMVLDFVAGQTLEKWAHFNPRPNADWLMGLVRRLLDTLEEIHAANILHRDVAPDNIMLRPGGDPVFIDFGAARSELGSRTKTFILVKEGYSPAEQQSGITSLQGPWTDIYALSATLYRIITGQVPMSGMARSASDDLVPVSVAAAGRYPSGLLTGIDAALRVRVKERPQSVAEWRQIIFSGRAPATSQSPVPPPAKPAEAEAPPSAPPSKPGSRFWPWDRAKKSAGPQSSPSGSGGGAQPAALDERETELATSARLNELTTRDDQAWTMATAAGTLAGWKKYAAEFPNGRHAAAAEGLIAVRTKNRLARTFNGHEGQVQSLAISADGRTALSGGADTTVRLWDTVTGELKRTLKAHKGRVWKNPRDRQIRKACNL